MGTSLFRRKWTTVDFVLIVVTAALYAVALIMLANIKLAPSVPLRLSECAAACFRHFVWHSRLPGSSIWKRGQRSADGRHTAACSHRRLHRQLFRRIDRLFGCQSSGLENRAQHLAILHICCIDCLCSGGLLDFDQCGAWLYADGHRNLVYSDRLFESGSIDGNTGASSAKAAVSVCEAGRLVPGTSTRQWTAFH